MVNDLGSSDVFHRGGSRHVLFPRKAGNVRGANQMGGQ